MTNRILAISLAVVLAISAVFIGCRGEAAPGTIRFTLTISSTEDGEVTNPGEGTYAYEEGTTVDLMAEPHETYRFVDWTGDVGTVADVGSASTTIVMNGDYSITANFAEDEVVTFLDPNLEAAVRQAIAKPEGPIYTRDMEQLESFYADGRGISSLAGLEYAISLRSLRLANNQIADVLPLASLTNLTDLRLGNNRVSDVSPLANLASLSSLDLWGNRISDIWPLADLTNLTSLNLWGNQITDISPLADLTGLSGIYLGGNTISDISPLATLGNLKWLGLDYNQISDVSPLADLTRLVEIYLGGNMISDISPLADLTNLNWLDLDNNQVSDISPLVNNPGLSQGDVVYLSNNPLGSSSINTYIAQLEARGVDVYY